MSVCVKNKICALRCGEGSNPRPRGCARTDLGTDQLATVTLVSNNGSRTFCNRNSSGTSPGKMASRRRWAWAVDVEGPPVVPGLGEEVEEEQHVAGSAMEGSASVLSP